MHIAYILKGALSRDRTFQVFLHDSPSLGPLIVLVAPHFNLVRKFTKILETRGAPLVSTSPEVNGEQKVFHVLFLH